MSKQLTHVAFQLISTASLLSGPTCCNVAVLWLRTQTGEGTRVLLDSVTALGVLDAPVSWREG